MNVNIIYIMLKRRIYFIRALTMDSLLLLFNAFISVSIISVYYNNSFLNALNNPEWVKVVSYVLLSTILNQSFKIGFPPEFSEQVRNGDFSRYYLLPIGIFRTIISECYGTTISRLIAFFPHLITANIIISIYFSTIKSAFFQITSVLLSGFILDLISISFFSFAIRLGNYMAARATFTAVVSLLSGALVPIILWPEKLRTLVDLLPFALIIDAPIQIILGTKPYLEIIVKQIVWIVILLQISKFVIKSNSKRFGSFGG